MVLETKYEVYVNGVRKGLKSNQRDDSKIHNPFILSPFYPSRYIPNSCSQDLGNLDPDLGLRW